MLVGYARVSTQDQTFALQQDALNAAGCECILTDTLSGALAEFERDLIRERTKAGLTAARAKGRKRGRPVARAFGDPKKLALARKLYAEKQSPVATICQMLKVSRATFYRYMGGSDAAADAS